MAVAHRTIRSRASSGEKAEHILVLDDDAHYADLMSATLSPFSDRFAIIEAGSVEEARRKVSGRKVKVFILDVQLPDGTGLDFYDEVRADHPGAVSVVVTGTSLIADNQFTERFGVDRLIRKPFRLALLREAVAELLAAAESRHAAAGEQPPPEAREDADQGEGMFAGVLKKLSITDIIQLKCISQASTIITLRSVEGELGKIHLDNGQIIHAETGELEGVAALNRIVLWNSGSVSESLPQDDTPQTIDGSWESLLMEAMRRKDEVQPG